MCLRLLVKITNLKHTTVFSDFHLGGIKASYGTNTIYDGGGLYPTSFHCLIFQPTITPPPPPPPPPTHTHKAVIDSAV